MATNNQNAASKGDYIFIDVRPKVVDDVIEDLRQVTLRPEKVLITLAAGIPLNKYAVLGDNLPVVRVLPNPSSQIGQGIAALAFNAYVTETQKEEILEIFKSLGEAEFL
jgi:pyrroline-5-carboxylate reductase